MRYYWVESLLPKWLPLSFFQETWPIVSSKVCQAVIDFVHNRKILKARNSNLITFIAKVDSPTSVPEYKPITCCSTIYKIIAKLLVCTIQVVQDELGGNKKSAFVRGRNIHDNILLAHNLVCTYSRKSISPRAMIEVDIKKAHDSIEWDFIMQTLVRLGFPSAFGQLIFACILYSSFSLSINGG